MNLYQFELFCQIAKVRSFTKAAKLMHLTQPAISAQVQAMENFYGTKLFERSATGVKLTPAGELVYKYAQHFLAEHEKLEREIDNLLGTNAQTIVIGASSTIGNFALPCNVWSFKEKYPEANIRIEVDNSKKVIDMVMEDKVDFGLAEGPEFTHPDLEVKKVGESQVVIITSPELPLARQDSITVEELKKLPLIMREPGSSVREVFFDAIKKAGVPAKELNIVLELGSFQGVLEAVKKGHGVSISCLEAIKKEFHRKELHYLTLKDMELIMPFLLVYRKDRAFSPLAKRFLRFIIGPAALEFC
ncbi:LysR family transcriptional regulator [Carboxydothermus ferrireducens]|uniref:DNA-binding transcriptional LysR family regulator n=1 Tax=Carboxydothermus ferrireducens DSM 11255 TaxID=1119529 RepID=A0ABX2R943_9THEO|nr:LysR family transcriptional regulator [Carboxydothermus ferrireducens]NYE57689.1 DNA-binding transcriptional LysR family regulator [Carboxydothermus ferrireducens DSM 11255]